MNSKQRSRALWIAAVVVLALTAALAVAWGLRQRDQARGAVFQLEAGYQRAFFAVVEHVENLELLLSKALASGSPMHQSLMLTRVHAEAMAAQQALANLPVGVDLQRSQQFLAQTGDFAYTVAERLAAGQAPEADDWTTLARLKAQTAQLMQDLADIRDAALEGRFLWTEVARRAPEQGGASGPGRPGTDDGTGAPGGGRGDEGAALPAQAGGGGSVADSLAELDRELQEVPTLVYDGPFSEQNLRPTPRADLGDMVTRDEAGRRAAAFFAGDDGGGWRAVPQGEARGPVPAFVFALEPDDRRSDPVTVHVSQEGGHVLWFLQAADPGGDAVSVDQARSRAEAFLRERRMDGFVVTGWVREGGRVTFSFAREQDDVLLYPELVKVGVDGSGRVVAYDARAYWLNREPGRSLPEPQVPRRDVQGLINPLLEMQQVRLALVPLPTGQHVLTYEVLGELAGDRFLLYYNALTGREEMILRVVEDATMRLGY